MHARGKTAFAAAIALKVALPMMDAAQPGEPTEIAWLGLFNGPLVEWLENENRLGSLCGAFRQDSGEWYECRAQQLAPKVHLVRLWNGPSERSQPIGSLRVLATPGQGLRSFFVPPAGGEGIEFRPDLFDSDWGYGPYFHISFLERRASWFRLPEEPFPKGTWVNAAEFGGDPELKRLRVGDILTSPFGDLFVLGIDRGVLRTRPEQESDMWCEGGEPPPLKPWKEDRIPVRDLYTPTGHSRLHIKYTRGC